MLGKLLQDRIQLEEQISEAAKAELQKLATKLGIAIDMSMGGISFEQNNVTVYYHEIFNKDTMNSNIRHPKLLSEFLEHRRFNNPYTSKEEALEEDNESGWYQIELRKTVAKEFYQLVCVIEPHFASEKNSGLWNLCGVCSIKP